MGSGQCNPHSLIAYSSMLMHLIKGEHTIEINHRLLGKTCGLLPIGVDSTVLSTTGLEWNLGAYRVIPQAIVV